MANRRPLVVGSGNHVVELIDADGLRIGNISLFDGGGGSAVNLELPKIGGQLLSLDPTTGRLTLGNDTTDVPGPMIWHRDNGEIQASNETGATVGTVVGGKLSIGVSTGFVGRTRLGYLTAECNTFADNGTILLYGKVGGSVLPLWRAIADNFRAQTITLGPPDMSAFGGTFIPDVTANRNYETPDRDGMMSLDDPQSITGLTIQTGVSGNTITIGAGSAYVQSVGRVIDYSGGTITGNPAAATMYHIYLLANGTVEKSTTAPTTPYAGSARSKTGDTSRRYLGSVKSITTTTWIPQKGGPSGNEVYVAFMHNVGTNSRLITAGASTTAADLSCAAYAPANVTTSVTVRIQNGGAAGVARIYCHDGSAFSLMTNVGPGSSFYLDVPTDTTPKIQYDVTSTSTMTVDLGGYIYRR